MDFSQITSLYLLRWYYIWLTYGNVILILVWRATIMSFFLCGPILALLGYMLFGPDASLYVTVPLLQYWPLINVCGPRFSCPATSSLCSSLEVSQPLSLQLSCLNRLSLKILDACFNVWKYLSVHLTGILNFYLIVSLLGSKLLYRCYQLTTFLLYLRSLQFICI